MPSIDLLDGRVVRLEKGREHSAIPYSDNPIKVASELLNLGVELVHLVDLNLALYGEAARNASVLRSLLQKFKGTSLKFQVGGGIKNKQIAKDLFVEGASKIVLGSLVYDNLPEAKSILEYVGTDRILVALDYDEMGFVRIHGWKSTANEKIVESMRRFRRTGFMRFLTTSIGRDGLLSGPDLSTLQNLRRSLPDVCLIASGGISCAKDIIALSKLGVNQAIIGRAWYEGKISKSTLIRYGKRSANC